MVARVPGPDLPRPFSAQLLFFLSKNKNIAQTGYTVFDSAHSSGYKYHLLLHGTNGARLKSSDAIRSKGSKKTVELSLAVNLNLSTLTTPHQAVKTAKVAKKKCRRRVNVSNQTGLRTRGHGPFY